MPPRRFQALCVVSIAIALSACSERTSTDSSAWRDYLTAEEADRILDYVAHEARLGHARGERRIVRRP